MGADIMSGKRAKRRAKEGQARSLKLKFVERCSCCGEAVYDDSIELGLGCMCGHRVALSLCQRCIDMGRMAEAVEILVIAMEDSHDPYCADCG